MPKTLEINVPEKAFLPCYKHLLGSKNDIEFLWGSRDSGKSRHIAQQLILKCLQNKKFLCPLIRKVVNTVKDSQWAMIKQIVEEWNIDHLFKFTINPLEIRCISGGKFLARGMDDPKKIKSLTDPSDAWIEEGNDLTEDDWIIITTSMRSNYFRTQIWFSFNPDIETNYEEFWLYKRFFEKHKNELSFSGKIVEFVNGEETEINYRTTHTTFNDNLYCPNERKVHYLNLKNIDEYSYMVYALGRWGLKRTGGEFFKSFDIARHVKSVDIDSNKIYHISVDNNVYPYIAITIWQIIKYEDSGNYDIVQVDEICAKEPDNTASRAGRLVGRWLREAGNYNTVFIYGDPTTTSRNTISDDKKTFLDKFVDEINKYSKTCNYLFRQAPSVESTGDFINSIYSNEIDNLRIIIGEKCKVSISDYMFTKQDRDGGILKKRITDTKTGISYEEHGHLSDTKRYFVIKAFEDQYLRFRNRFNNFKGAYFGKRNEYLNY